MMLRLLNLLVLLLLFAFGRAAAQKPDSGAFFVRLGRDTVAVERYVRTEQQLTAEALLRSPQTRWYKMTITWAAPDRIAWYEILNSPVKGVPNSAPVLRTVVTYTGDSAVVQYWTGGVQRPARTIAAKPHMVPMQFPFYSTHEAALMRAGPISGDSSIMHMLIGNGPFQLTLRQPAPDTITLSAPVMGTLRAHVDRNRRLRELNAEGTTFKAIITRSPWLDLQPYAERYATADIQGKSLGLFSPRDTVVSDVAGAEIVVDYGRPSKRGRVIFGNVVPWSEVWRTGANAATQIWFNRDIELGGVNVPAGKYSLWTLPARSGWKLIINKQTGQWGTSYDPAQDLARIDVPVENVAVPVETFTIAIEPKGDTSNEATLTLTWDRTRVRVPLRVQAQ